MAKHKCPICREYHDEWADAQENAFVAFGDINITDNLQAYAQEEGVVFEEIMKSIIPAGDSRL